VNMLLYPQLVRNEHRTKQKSCQVTKSIVLLVSFPICIVLAYYGCCDVLNTKKPDKTGTYKYLLLSNIVSKSCIMHQTFCFGVYKGTYVLEDRAVKGSASQRRGAFLKLFFSKFS